MNKWTLLKDRIWRMKANNLISEHDSNYYCNICDREGKNQEMNWGAKRGYMGGIVTHFKHKHKEQWAFIILAD